MDDVEQARDGSRRRKMLSRFHLKSLAAVEDAVGGWDVVGRYSVFDREDYSKDVVRPGATAASLARHLPKILDHHGATVGQATKAYEDESGLWVEGRIYPTAAGTDLVTLMQPIQTDHGPHAPVEQGSIGYSILEGGSKRRPGGGLELTKLRIWEVSPVTFADNPATSVGLKSLDAVHRMPTADLLAYAGEMARVAVDGADGAKALRRRRVAEDRDLTEEQWRAVDELLLSAADAALELLTLKARAGRLASAAQRRHTRSMAQELAALLDGDPGQDVDRTGVSPPTDDASASASAGAGGESGSGRESGAAPGPGSRDPRASEADLDEVLADLGLDPSRADVDLLPADPGREARRGEDAR